MDYASRHAQLNAKLTRLRSQITTAEDKLADIENSLMMKGKKPTKAQETQIHEARKKINTALDRYERAVAEFHLDMEKRHEEARQKTCEEV
jgi:Skp family chaperone for outer membrane proteins